MRDQEGAAYLLLLMEVSYAGGEGIDTIEKDGPVINGSVLFTCVFHIILYKAKATPAEAYRQSGQ